ncbi:unnamed protein product [Schistosoma turkestanicum]|nr:unnamed protein product [Schistosoma turkestanicum]
MDINAEKSPLTQSEETSNKSNFYSVAVVRPKHPRRYKLLPKDKLRFPRNDNAHQFWRKTDYSKHMPLINVNYDNDDEEFNVALFQNVANKGLCDYLKADQLSSYYHHHQSNSTDDWDLHLSIPNEFKKQQTCCPFNNCCTLS